MIRCDTKSCYLYILDLLPPLCRKSITDVQKKYVLNDTLVNEIRLRYKRNVSLTAANKSFFADYVMSEQDMKNTLSAICRGSVYAYQKTIKRGYIPLPFGGRAGVVGELADEELDVAVETITSVNIRIPHHIRGKCGKIFDLFLKHGKGMIIYAPPGVGKTTFLRDLSIELSRGSNAKKVALVDSRRELDNGQIPSDCLIDTLAGYPKSLGIEIAVRTMSCDIIVCDEIGADEVAQIRKSLFCGVPVIAAAHASSFSELCSREGISSLINEGAFSHAVGIRRGAGKTEFDFEVTVLGDN